MKKVEQIKNLVDATFGKFSETSLINDRKTAIEFVMSSTLTKSVVAVFLISKDNLLIFQVKYIDAGYLEELHLLATKLSEEFMKEVQE